MNGRKSFVSLVLCVVFCVVLLPQWLLAADRPNALHLLPEGTLALVRVTDSRQLVKRFDETSMGRIGQDDQIRPLVKQLYGTVSEAFGEIEEQVGLPLDKILSLPQGELVFAVVAPPAGPPAIVVMIEVGDQMPAFKKLIARGEEQAVKDGARKTVEKFGDVEFNIFSDGDAEGRDGLIYFEREGTFVAGTHKGVLKDLIDAWDGKLAKDDKTLAEDRKFTTVMNRCIGSKDDPPQLMFYVDPIRTAKVSARGDFQAQTVIALLPALGVDGIEAIGGSVTMATGEFDSILHLHVMIDEPRGGVVEAIALTAGDTTPEDWVPDDISSYTTLNYDVEKSFASVAKVINSLALGSTLENMAQKNIGDRLEVDFQKDLLQACAGRFTLMNWVERPIHIGSQSNLVGIKLKDAKTFQKVFDKLTDKYKDNLEKTSFATTVYWKLRGPDRERGVDLEREPGRVALSVKPPQPCFAIVDNYLLVTDRPAILEHAIAATRDTTKALSKDLEYKLIMSKIKRQPGGDTPAMVSFNRPEEAMRMVYDLAVSEQTKSLLASQAENNNFFKGVDKAMKDNPLPPFSVLQKYLAPGGALMTTDETGIHYAAFQLRRK